MAIIRGLLSLRHRAAAAFGVGGLGLLALVAVPGPTAFAGEKARPQPHESLQMPPLPPPRPADIGLPRADPAKPHAAKPEPGEAPQLGPPAELAGPPKGPSSADPTPCLDHLAKLGVQVEAMPPISQGACGAEHPFRVKELPAGVDATPAAEVGCPMAEALARWVLEAVGPEAERHLAAEPAKLLIGTSYECRAQNRDANAKLSEHAFANAVDVMGFAFAARPALSIAERGEDTPEGRFQAAVRSRACAYFTTVLGPGSDASHADHLHLDLRERKAGARLCQ